MKALEWITKEAKKLRKDYPKRFATWKEYVAQASAIYASKHKGKSSVGKKKIGETNTSTHTDTKSHNINIKMGNTIFDQNKLINFQKLGKDNLNELKTAAEEYTKYQKKYFDAVAISHGTGYVVLTLSPKVKAMYVLSFGHIVHRGKKVYTKPQFLLYSSSGPVLVSEELKNPTYKLISKFNK